MLRADPELELSPESFLRTSSAKIKSRMSSYFSLDFPAELLTAVLIPSQLLGSEASKMSARISSSNSISTDYN